METEVIEQLDNKIKVVILQHPQEPKQKLGTAPLCLKKLKNVEVKIGLSWRSHKELLGETAQASEWGVLYLGGKSNVFKNEVNFVNKKMQILHEQPYLQGLVVLDGTWSQAKALWWRNAWLLKLRRIVLNPKEVSLYGKLRKEPRRECLSTLESIALVLSYIEKDPSIAEKLKSSFQSMLEKK